MINYGNYVQTNKCILSQRKKNTFLKGILLVMWRNLAREGWRWMLTYSLRVFTDAVKCNPGILPVIMPHNVYHYVINNHSRPPKVWMLIRVLCQDGQQTPVTGFLLYFDIDTSLCIIPHIVNVNVGHLWYMTAIPRWNVEHIHNFPSVSAAASFCSLLLFKLFLKWI